MVLLEGLERVQSFFQKNSCRLPISPSLVSKELNIKVRIDPVEPTVSFGLSDYVYQLRQFYKGLKNCTSKEQISSVLESSFVPFCWEAFTCDSLPYHPCSLPLSSCFRSRDFHSQQSLNSVTELHLFSYPLFNADPLCCHVEAVNLTKTLRLMLCFCNMELLCFLPLNLVLLLLQFQRCTSEDCTG